MKKVYVPSGEVVSYTNLHTGRLVVKGMLNISGKLVAKEIVGGGVIQAREIICDSIHASCVTADFVTAKRILVDKLFVQFECRASESIAAKDYVSAGYISTGSLTMSLSDIYCADADEIITLKPKRRLLGLLWASWWRGLFFDLFHSGKKASSAAPSEPEQPEADAGDKGDLPEVQPDEMADAFKVVASELRKQGYSITRSDSEPDKKDTAA